MASLGIIMPRSMSTRTEAGVVGPFAAVAVLGFHSVEPWSVVDLGLGHL